MKKFILLSLLFAFSCQKDSRFVANNDPKLKGCGDFSVYKIIADDMIASVYIDHNKIAFDTDYQTFEQIENEAFATIEIEQNCDITTVWDNACNDVFQQASCTSTNWKLKSGKLSFKVSRVPSSYNCSELYLATVILENADFVKEGTTETMHFDQIDFSKVQVGWCAG